MKYIGAILILSLIFYLSFSLLKAQDHPAAGDGFSETGAQEKSSRVTESEETIDDMEEDYYVDEQEVFSRKLFQKYLDPLSKKQEIIWAFRESKTHTFL
jgi:hypothetical protein